MTRKKEVRPLTDTRYLRQLLAEHSLSPRKGAGQNFLVCREPLTVAVSTLAGGPKQLTELGAGLGTLTQALLGAGYLVRAIERDEQLATLLTEEMSTSDREHLELVLGDLRECPWTWETPYQLVGNIPYNLSGLIIRRITQLEPAPHQAVLLVQQEVADRMTASPNAMSMLSLAIGLWGSARVLLPVPAECFWPRPKVASALVALAPREEAGLPLDEREAILKFAKPLFRGRRKQLGGTLRAELSLTEGTVKQLLQQAGVRGQQRPQELSVQQWCALYSATRTDLGGDGPVVKSAHKPPD